jgi:hypothetical protein
MNFRIVMEMPQDMTGLEVLTAIVDGRIEHPTMAHTLGFRPTDKAVSNRLRPLRD